MIYIKYITAIIISILFVSCNSITHVEQKLSVVSNGVIDLTSHDFDKSGIVDLDGKWEFYWLQLYTPEDFKNSKKPQHLRYITLPGSWSQKELISDKSDFGSLGHATYRLIIKIKNNPDKINKYALKIMEMNCSYNLYVNGSLVSSNGIVSDNPKEMKPQFHPKIIFFQLRSDEIEVIIQISNYVDNKGGSLRNISLGLPNQIILKKEKALISELILFGILLIMGIYHILIYFFRKRDISLLYFGFLCLTIAQRISLSGERFIYLMLHNVNWETLVKLEHLSIYFILLSITLFINSLYKKDSNKYLISFFLIITISYILIILFSPAIIFSTIILSYIYCLILYIFYFLSVLIRVWIKKRESASLMLAGYFFLFIAAINDVLYNLGYINSGNFLQFGMIIFILIQSMVISLNFNKTFIEITSLSKRLILEQKRLEDKNLELDQKVIERTRIINNQKNEIENQITMAESIQKSILPKTIPDLDGIELSFIYKPMMLIGGDFVDYIIKNDNEIGFFICDVSGHGVPGAFLSSMVKMELMNNWYHNISLPAEVLNNIYNAIRKNLGGNFITASVSYLNIESGEYIMANAGHPPAFNLYGNNEIKILKPHGKAIFEFYKPYFEETRMNLQAGSKIFMYTDGIIESFNPGFKEYGENNLIQFLKKNSHLNVNELCNSVLKEVIDFTGDEKNLNDDITLLAFEYKGK